MMALNYSKLILTEISASRQDRRVLQKKQNHQNQISEHMGHATDVWIHLHRNLEKTILTEISQCTAVLYNDCSLQMGPGVVPERLLCILG